MCCDTYLTTAGTPESFEKFLLSQDDGHPVQLYIDEHIGTTGTFCEYCNAPLQGREVYCISSCAIIGATSGSISKFCSREHQLSARRNHHQATT